MTGKTINLLVLSGVHAGARAELVKNETKIGHGESCDLIFSDQNIKNVHCRVVLEDDKILIYRQDGDVMLYDKSIDMAEVVIGTTFSIGDVQVAVVDDDTDINNLSAAEAPPPVIDDPAMMPYEATLKKTTDVEDYEREYEHEEEDTAHDRSHKRTGWQFALTGASAVFVVVLGLLAWELLSVAGVPTKGTLEKNPRAFHDYMASGYPDFVVEQVNPESFIVEGTVSTHAEKQTFIRDIRGKFGFSYIWRIVAIEDIITDLKAQLGFYGANLSVSYADGHINIRGYLADDTLLNELKADVKKTTDIPTVWNIYGAKELESQFAKTLTELKIPGSSILRYKWSENRLTLVSYKSANNEKATRELETITEKVETDLNIPLWVDYQFIDRPTGTAVAQTESSIDEPCHALRQEH